MKDLTRLNTRNFSVAELGLMLVAAVALTRRFAKGAPWRDPGRNPHRPSRPGWKPETAERYPVRPGEHRRHIVSYRYFRNLARHFTEEHLRALGYDPAKYDRSVEKARKAWIIDRFNDPANFWRGAGWVNSWLGRWMHLFEEFNIDIPSDEAKRREEARRKEEQAQRDREERERRERREREDRERPRTRGNV